MQGKQKTHTEFVNEIRYINPNIKIEGIYSNARTKIECICLICGNKWSATPTSLLSGTGCMECAKKKMSNLKRKTHEAFANEMKFINPNIEVIGEYINSKIKIKCKCLVCNKEWNAIPNSLLHGSCCPHCDRDNRRKTHENFIDEVKIVNPNIRIMGNYLGRNIKIKCKCMICNNEWESRPGHILNGVGCPSCVKSRGEGKIEAFLQKNNIAYIPQKKFENLLGVGGGKLSYDFYIPDYNTLVEYNGQQHEESISYFGGYEKFKKQQEHDKRKRDFASKYKYTLIEIPYTDFSKIKNILYDELIFQRG